MSGLVQPRAAGLVLDLLEHIVGCLDDAFKIELRRDEWNPAVCAAGLEHRTPHALRHTFASFAIAAPAPISTFEIARMMGTSVKQIEKTYGYLLPDALDRGRASSSVA